LLNIVKIADYAIMAWYFLKMAVPMVRIVKIIGDAGYS
jgi:hypothetical protein